MHNALLRATPLAAIALLAACQPTTVTASDNDPTKNEIAAAPPVKLPPALLASKTYRCKDNSIVYVDFFNDNTTANFRTDKTGAATPLVAPEAGQPYVGGGVTIDGSADAATVQITYGGKPAQSCKA